MKNSIKFLSLVLILSAPAMQAGRGFRSAKQLARMARMNKKISSRLEKLEALPLNKAQKYVSDTKSKFSDYFLQVKTATFNDFSEKRDRYVNSLNTLENNVSECASQVCDTTARVLSEKYDRYEKSWNTLKKDTLEYFSAVKAATENDLSAKYDRYEKSWNTLKKDTLEYFSAVKAATENDLSAKYDRYEKTWNTLKKDTLEYFSAVKAATGKDLNEQYYYYEKSWNNFKTDTSKYLREVRGVLEKNLNEKRDRLSVSLNTMKNDASEYASQVGDATVRDFIEKRDCLSASWNKKKNEVLSYLDDVLFATAKDLNEKRLYCRSKIDEFEKVVDRAGAYVSDLKRDLSVYMRQVHEKNTENMYSSIENYKKHREELSSSINARLAKLYVDLRKNTDAALSVTKNNINQSVVELQKSVDSLEKYLVGLKKDALGYMNDVLSATNKDIEKHVSILFGYLDESKATINVRLSKMNDYVAQIKQETKKNFGFDSNVVIPTFAEFVDYEDFSISSKNSGVQNESPLLLMPLSKSLENNQNTSYPVEVETAQGLAEAQQSGLLSEIEQSSGLKEVLGQKNKALVEFSPQDACVVPVEEIIEADFSIVSEENDLDDPVTIVEDSAVQEIENQESIRPASYNFEWLGDDGFGNGIYAKYQLNSKGEKEYFGSVSQDEVIRYEKEHL